MTDNRQITITQEELNKIIADSVASAVKKEVKTASSYLAVTPKKKNTLKPAITIFPKTVEIDGMIKDLYTISFKPIHSKGRPYQFLLDCKFMINHREFLDETQAFWDKQYEELYEKNGGSLPANDRLPFSKDDILKFCRLGLVSKRKLRLFTLPTLQKFLNSVYGVGSVYKNNVRMIEAIVKRGK